MSVLNTLGDWFSVNGECLEGTQPLYPFEDNGVFLMAKQAVVYLIVPSTSPTTNLADPGPELIRSHRWQRQVLQSSQLYLSFIRPGLLADEVCSARASRGLLAWSARRLILF